MTRARPTINATFTYTGTGTGIAELKLLLKRLIRAHGFRCTDIREVDPIQQQHVEEVEVRR